MNTNQLKTFAQKARNIVRRGVTRQLKYWGFDENGNVEVRPEKVEGGIIHREEVIDDPGILPRWEGLNKAVRRKGFDQVVEEAAYTWFNRIMAVRILSKNGYDIPQLEYNSDDSKTPLILTRARRGQYSFLSQDEQIRLKTVIADYTKEAQAFAILLTGYCHSHTLLNNVFGRLDDYTELLLPIDMLSETGFIHFLNTTSAISDDDYRQVELIGWLYQFYISEKKDEVFKQFKKKKKAEAKDIPAATQIFTPNWIVKYMVENTVGKIWLDKHPDSPLKAKMKYLVESPDQPLGAPLISEVSELKLLDPAAGSGHILVEGFELLYAMYEEEFYMPEEAVESILKNNLFGLDIDLRAAQLARFALLMKAASKYPDILKKNILPKVFAMPEPANFSRQEILDFLGSEGLDLEDKLSRALQLMQQAQNLGSTMQFDFSETERNLIVQRLKELQNKAIRNNLEETLLQKMTPFIEVLAVLTNHYEAIAANPPYMGSSNMNGELKQYVNSLYSDSKSDLMTVFMEVIPNLARDDSRFALINLPSWLFLSSFEKLREDYISKVQFESMLHMGRGIFGIDFGSVAFAIRKQSNPVAKGNYFRLHERNFQHIYYEDIEKLFLYSNGNEKYKYDFSLYRDSTGKTTIPRAGTKNGLKLFFPNTPQVNFSKIPGSPIAYWVSEKIIKLFENESVEKYADLKEGTTTGNNELYLKNWHEISFSKVGLDNNEFNTTSKWYPYNKGGAYRKWYGNNNHVINWENNGEEVKREKRSTVRNMQYCLKEGGTWSAISAGGLSMRYFPNGYIFDSKGPVLISKKENLHFLIGQLNSNTTNSFMSFFGATMDFRLGNLKKLPLILDKVLSVDELVVSNIAISRKDWDSFETSWDFKSSSLLNEKYSLFEAYQCWSKEVSEDFFQLHNNEEELNRLFIDVYGLNDELDPIVRLKDITILQNELDFKDLEKTDKALRKRRKWELVNGKWELFVNESVPLPELPIKRDVVMKQLISYALGCMMGRYRLDQPGLHIAHPNPTPEEVCTYSYNGNKFEIDDDAIIPLMGSNCTFADDAVNRFNHFLEVVWGADTLTENKNFLEECLDQEVEKYLVKDFWKDHCKTYKKKPIYWLFSSEKGAFQVLTYMHRMNRFTAEKIRSKYLLKHLQYLMQEKTMLEKDSALLSREELKRLENIRSQYEECQRYELLLKDYADKQIEFDLDDGVSANYELFKGVVTPIK